MIKTAFQTVMAISMLSVLAGCAYVFEIDGVKHDVRIYPLAEETPDAPDFTPTPAPPTQTNTPSPTATNTPSPTQPIASHGRGGDR